MSRLLLFDIDGTLIKTSGVGRGAINQAFEELFGVPAICDGMRFDGRTDRGIFYEALAKGEVPVHEHDQAFERLVAGYLARLDQELRDKGGVVFPGIVELLEALAGEPAAVGLATGNLREGARKKMVHFGLWQHFAGGGFGDAVHERTSLVASAIVEVAAARQFAADGANAIVIGDTPLDVAGALANGARCLGVATGSYSVDELLASGATWAVPDLTDTNRMVDILVRA